MVQGSDHACAWLWNLQPCLLAARVLAGTRKGDNESKEGVKTKREKKGHQEWKHETELGENEGRYLV